MCARGHLGEWVEAEWSQPWNDGEWAGAGGSDNFRAELPKIPLRRLLLLERWLLVRETLGFGFDVYRNLKQADIRNRLVEPTGKAITEAGVWAEQKNDSRFPSVVPWHCAGVTRIQDGLEKYSKCKWQWWHLRWLWACAYLCVLGAYMIRRCLIFLPLYPTLKFQKEFQIYCFICMSCFQKKVESFMYIEFLKHKANGWGWTHLQQNINHLKLLFIIGITL